MKIFHFLLYLNIQIPSILNFLNPDEIILSLDLIKEFQIRQCVLIGDRNNENLHFAIKKLTMARIPVTYFNYDQILNYVLASENSFYKIGLVFSEKNLTVLENFTRIIDEATGIHKLRNFAWLIFLQNYHTEIHEKNRLMVPYDCEFVVIQPQNSKTYEINEIYSIRNRQFFSVLGQWDLSSGLKTTNLSFYQRRSNFEGSEIMIKFPRGSRCETILSNTCQMYDIFLGFGLMLNLTNLGEYIRPNQNYLEALDQEADILALFVPYLPKYYRKDVIGPIFTTVINWYVKYPKTELRSDYYLQPFDTNTWLCLILFVILGSGFTILQYNLLKKSEQFLMNNLFLGLEIFCNQSKDNDAENTGIRFIRISLRITALFLVAAYGAVITSFMSVDVFTPPFSDLKGFIDNGEYKLLVENNSAFNYHLKGYDSPLIQKIYENFTKLYDLDYEELSEKVCDEKFAMYVYDFDPVAYDLKTPCALFKIPQPISKVFTVLYVRQNSPFTKILNKKFLRFHEAGLQKRISKFLKPRHLESKQEELFKPVQFKQMVQVLSIPIGGILIAVVILVFELITKRYYLKA